jgi:replicative DNA helicase
MGMKVNREDPEYLELKHKAEIIIGKQRNGPVGDLELVFVDEFAKFENKVRHPHIDVPASTHADQPF